jgi:hypothetical protein
VRRFSIIIFSFLKYYCKMADYSACWFFISRIIPFCTLFSYPEAYCTCSVSSIHISLTKSIDCPISTQQINTPGHFTLLHLWHWYAEIGLKFILFRFEIHCFHSRVPGTCWYLGICTMFQQNANTEPFPKPAKGPWPHRYATFMFTKWNVKAYVSVYRDHNFSWMPYSALRFGSS